MHSVLPSKPVVTEVEQEKEDEQKIQDQRPPHPRVYQAIQQDQPIDSILGDIQKGVTTCS
jgi:hypothetical protein